MWNSEKWNEGDFHIQFFSLKIIPFNRQRVVRGSVEWNAEIMLRFYKEGDWEWVDNCLPILFHMTKFEFVSFVSFVILECEWQSSGSGWLGGGKEDEMNFSVRSDEENQNGFYSSLVESFYS